MLIFGRCEARTAEHERTWMYLRRPENQHPTPPLLKIIFFMSNSSKLVY